MAKRLTVVLIVLIIFSVAGAVLNWILRTRNDSLRLQCQWNMKTLAGGVEDYHHAHNHFPTATLPNDLLPPEKRLSWLIGMLANFGIGGGKDAMWPEFDRKKGWDDPANFPLKERNIQGQISLMSGYYSFLCCPADPSQPDAVKKHFTMYVGSTGIGADAARLPLDDWRVGFFGYDRKITRADIQDGLSTSVSICETGKENDCWFKGGFPTARGLVKDDFPYLGEDGQFSSRHRASNFAFADGSVRAISEGITPRTLEALFTIRGGEAVDPVGDD